MQKTLITLLGLLLIGVFFFIQNNEDKKNNTQLSIHNKIENKVLSNTKKIVNNTKKNKPFNSNINLAQEASKKDFTDADKKELESKSQKELRKDIFIDIQIRMMTEMQTIPTCLEDAQNKQEALTCNKKLQNINKEFELLLGINTDNVAKHNPYEFVWNETTKENMIKELDAGIEPMQKMFSCLKSADNDTEEEKCFDLDNI